MPADYIQLVGTDVPGSYGSCCFSGQVQHEALRYRCERMTLESLSAEAAAAAAAVVEEEKGRRGSMCSDGELLLFNCPEGTQRFASEANVRLVRVRGFFFTRWAASTVMGIPGLLFTINDAGVQHANFFGPSGTCSVVEATETKTRVFTPGEEREHDAATGLAGMLGALRRHYFGYRQMSFQQLRAGVVMRQLATPLPWNYVFDVPLPQTAMDDGDDDNDDDDDDNNNNNRNNNVMDKLGGSAVHPGDGRLLSPFFVLALLLSPTSALLGFRVSRGTGAPADTTLGYAILHAPAASFDPHLAKSLGVPPGPMYGQLKQGSGVWLENMQHGGIGGDEGAKAAPRFVHPQSVKRMTVGSRSIYVSLLLDGDSCDDVAAAMQSLFGCDEAIDEEQVQQGQQTENNPFSSACDGRSSGGELRRLLAQWQPSLLYCDGHAHSVSDSPLTERLVILVHVVHLQCARFFYEMGVEPSLVEAQEKYAKSIFACVQQEIRVQALRSFSRQDSSAFDGTAMTTHHFCAAVQQQFSAFPTALTHRYHLNSVAPAQFPIPLAPSGGDNDKEKGSLWPYAIKHQLIPPDALSSVIEKAQNPVRISTAHTHTAARGALDSSMTNVKCSNATDSVAKQNTTGILRYPTRCSALAMLSETFRATTTASCQLVETSSPFPPQLPHHDGGGALTFLGTGSAVPSKYRNVSGTYLEVMYQTRKSAALSRTIVVLDFGEGSLGQLALLWGSDSDEAQRCFVEDLAFVFISHAHADHHLGLLSLLELRHRVLGTRHAAAAAAAEDKGEEPLLVVCPQEVHEFLLDMWGSCTGYCQWLKEEVIFEIIPAERFRVHGGKTAPVFLPKLDALCRHLHNNTVAIGAASGGRVGSDGTAPSMQVWAAEVFPVHHPANAHALLLRFPSLGGGGMSRVMLFSGDTRPSSFLIERCRKFTAGSCSEELEEMEQELFLCLHEATFGEGYEEEAVRKCHSTLPEALQVAAAIRARHVVLNHFSQRYPKLPGLMKSQLDGMDVDLHCRRRKLPPSEKAPNCSNGSSINYPNFGAGPDGKVQNAHQEESLSLDATVAVGARAMCFGFDFMRLTFASLESQQVARLTPMFVRLLQEYESWGVGTTKRLRD